MTDKKTADDNNTVIESAIEHISFFLFAILSDCYPEIATSEFETLFNEEIRIDINSFIKNYRQQVATLSGKSMAQAYASQRFFEKLSRALNQYQKDKPGEAVNYVNRSLVLQSL
ncbi:hypothetical protein [Dickeya sp. DW 0440]|uniref:hypothetical protein n=1 Tax=Dickeya sp. DW 0440 TaxID=1225785 RepID=UPI000556079D|nr:hypothetical protein [Dickeya sp. DW 0440]